MSRRSRRVIRPLLLIVVPVIGIVAALHYVVVAQRYVTTENAYVKAHNIGISAEVDGRVAEVAVAENVLVEAGDLLFRIDPEPFRIALDKAEAALAMVRLRIDALKAEYRQATQELREAEQNVAFYRREYERRSTLSRRGVVSRAALDSAEQNLAAARLKVGGIREKRDRILARLGGSLDLPAEMHPEFLVAKANRDDAALDLQRASVHAPVDGVVGPVNLQPGEYVRAGEPVLPLMSSDEIWIEANLKETQLTYVRPGLEAEIVVDAYPGRKVRATVASVSPFTGAELSILPPQNASGNWVKVVQRVPVRLVLDAADPELRLRAGMTASVSIDTRREYSLIGLAGSALARITEK